MTRPAEMTPERPPRARGDRARASAWLWYLGWLGTIMALTAGGAPVESLHGLAVITCPVVVLLGVWLHRPARPAPWFALAAGLAAFAVGDLLWLLAGPFGTPSVVDGTYYAGYLGIGLALCTFARRRGAGSALVIDAGVIAGSAGAILGLSVVWPFLSDRPDLGPAVAALAYPIASGILYTIALALALAGGDRLTNTLLCGGLLGLFAADTAFAAEAMTGLYVPRTTLLLLWATFYAGIGALALHPAMARLDQRTGRHVGPLSRRRFLLLMVAVISVPIADLLTPLFPLWGPSVAVAALLVLVAVRLSGVVLELQSAASVDRLTGLPNRASLDHELERLLTGPRAETSARAGRQHLVVLFCDLDEFKVVNDSLGHPAGDRLLVTVAERLRATVRSRDVVARLGGDEFVVLLDDVGTDEVGEIVARVQEEIARPVALADGAEVRPSVSIGVRAASPGATAESLLRDADTAMYEAKHRGRARAEHFTAALHTQVVERIQLEGALHRAVAADELFCLYQPEIALPGRHLAGVEALVRWKHPQRGVLNPATFIPLAESSGSIDAIFRHVLRTAVADHAELGRHLRTRPFLAVNLSTRQLADASLPDFIASVLEVHGVQPDQLWLELTETALAAERSDSLAMLRQLHDLGVKLAIDDFGTGWSTLARLASHPWDALKIDREFVANLHEPTTESIVAAMVAMGRALGLLTVAEGVETHDQLDRLEAMGCDLAQGYLISRPTSSEAIAARVAPDGTWFDTDRAAVPGPEARLSL